MKETSSVDIDFPCAYQRVCLHASRKTNSLHTLKAELMAGITKSGRGVKSNEIRDFIEGMELEIFVAAG